MWTLVQRCVSIPGTHIGMHNIKHPGSTTDKYMYSITYIYIQQYKRKLGEPIFIKITYNMYIYLFRVYVRRV